MKRRRKTGWRGAGEILIPRACTTPSGCRFGLNWRVFPSFEGVVRSNEERALVRGIDEEKAQRRPKKAVNRLWSSFQGEKIISELSEGLQMVRTTMSQNLGTFEGRYCTFLSSKLDGMMRLKSSSIPTI